MLGRIFRSSPTRLPTPRSPTRLPTSRPIVSGRLGGARRPRVLEHNQWNTPSSLIPKTAATSLKLTLQALKKKILSQPQKTLQYVKQNRLGLTISAALAATILAGLIERVNNIKDLIHELNKSRTELENSNNKISVLEREMAHFRSSLNYSTELEKRAQQETAELGKRTQQETAELGKRTEQEISELTTNNIKKNAEFETEEKENQRLYMRYDICLSVFSAVIVLVMSSYGLNFQNIKDIFTQAGRDTVCKMGLGVYLVRGAKKYYIDPESKTSTFANAYNAVKQCIWDMPKEWVNNVIASAFSGIGLASDQSKMKVGNACLNISNALEKGGDADADSVIINTGAKLAAQGGGEPKRDAPVEQQNFSQVTPKTWRKSKRSINVFYF